jgi:hypothetical protein
MRVRLNPVIGWILLAPAAFVLLTGLFLGQVMLIVLGVMQVLISIGYLTGTFFEISDHELGVKNLLGMTLKRHAFGSLAELEVRGTKICRRADGATLVGRTTAHRGDWEMLCGKIAAAGTAPAPK